MTPVSSHARTEIFAQADALRATLSRLKESAPDLRCADARVVFVGCGSSFYLAQFAAEHATRAHRRAARAVPASEIWLDPAGALGDADVLVAVSRSGTTTEVLRAVEAARDHGVAVTGLTLAGDSPLAAVDGAVVLDHVTEHGIVMTVSFATMLLALQVMIDGPNAERQQLETAIDVLPELLPAFEDAAREFVGAAPEQYVILGAGPMAALAEEGALKLREMTQRPVSAFQTLEFRHGPISIVECGVAVIALRGTRNAARLDAIGAEIAALDGKFLLIGPQVDGATPALPQVPLPAGLSEGAYALLALPFVQILALLQAEALGLHPDEPRHLNRVVTLDAGAAE